MECQTSHHTCRVFSGSVKLYGWHFHDPTSKHSLEMDPIQAHHFYCATEYVGPVKREVREEKLGKFISIVTWFKFGSKLNSINHQRQGSICIELAMLVGGEVEWINVMGEVLLLCWVRGRFFMLCYLIFYAYARGVLNIFQSTTLERHCNYSRGCNFSWRKIYFNHLLSRWAPPALLSRKF